MALNYETGGDLSNGGKFVDQEGWYHFLVTAGTETPVKKFGADKGNIIAGMMAQFDLAVLASSVPHQEDKTMDECLRAPSSQHKDGGDFCRKIADRWWLALGLVTRQQLEAKGSNVSINVADARGRQIIAKVHKNDKYFEIDGANVFHVDDPAVKDVPKNERALSTLPASQRWIGEQSQAKSEPAPPSGRPPLSDL